MTTADNEIGIYDLWLVVRRRWRLATAFCAMVWASAFAFAMTHVDRYELTSLLEIGRVGAGAQAPLIETTDAVLLRLKKGIVSQVIREQFGADSSLAPRVDVASVAGQGVISLTSAAPLGDLSKVKALHLGIFDALRALHAQRFEQQFGALITPLQNRIAETSIWEKDLRQQISNISSVVDSSAVTGSPQDLLTASKLADLRRDLLQIDMTIINDKRQLETIRQSSQNTRVTELVGQGDRPVGPSRALIVALGGMLGLLAGAFSAFVAEAFGNAKRVSPTRTY